MGVLQVSRQAVSSVGQKTKAFLQLVIEGIAWLLLWICCCKALENEEDRRSDEESATSGQGLQYDTRPTRRLGGRGASEHDESSRPVTQQAPEVPNVDGLPHAFEDRY